MNKKGFTLSEVLITLGVLGIVAVLTIPGVMKNYQNRLYTAQLEKVYAQISDATQSIMNDQHVDNFYETTARGATVCDATMKTCTSGIGYLLTNYFKTVKKNCLNNTNEACMTTKANTYQTIGGSKLSAPTGEYFIQTITGTTIGGMSTTTDKKRTRLIVDITVSAVIILFMLASAFFTFDVMAITNANLLEMNTESFFYNTFGQKDVQITP